MFKNESRTVLDSFMLLRSEFENRLTRPFRYNINIGEMKSKSKLYYLDKIVEKRVSFLNENARFTVDILLK